MKKFLMITRCIWKAYVGALKQVYKEKYVAWTFNETFFYGLTAEQNRDLFQQEHKALVEKYKSFDVWDESNKQQISFWDRLPQSEATSGDFTYTEPTI